MLGTGTDVLLAVSARCTYVGVGGSILTGGISWLSSEYGLASDPHNLLDAQVVKVNGDVVWASQETGLLWALRGGGGGFGGMTIYSIRGSGACADRGCSQWSLHSS